MSEEKYVYNDKIVGTTTEEIFICIDNSEYRIIYCAFPTFEAAKEYCDIHNSSYEDTKLHVEAKPFFVK